jgi:magnesium chelatase family protein
MTDHLPASSGTARGAAITGTEARIIEISADISSGPDAFRIIGLNADPGTREVRDRIRAAVIINSGLTWPRHTITASLAPAGVPRYSGALDLAVTVAVLAATGLMPAGAGGCVLAAELGLDGSLRPVCGILPAVLSAAASGCTTVIVAPGNAAEAVLAPGMTVVSCPSLRAVTGWLTGKQFPGSTLHH